MSSDRSSHPTSFLVLLGCWERRIGFRLHVDFRAFDPAKEITRRLFPNDHLEAPCQRMTSYRSLVLAVHALSGSAFQCEGA